MMNTLRALALALALSITACGETQGPPAKTTGSRASEYRAGLDAYGAGRILYAFEHFRAAAEMGNADAQYYVGLMYSNGEATKQSYEEAAKWYLKAVAQNQPDAIVQLARLHVTGLAVEHNPRKAIELFGRAAKIFPPGEKRDQALQQKQALEEALAAQAPAAQPTS